MGHSASSPSISIYASYANSSATATAICAAMTVDGVTSETCKGLPPGPTQTSGATTESAVSKLPDTAQGGQGGKEVVGNEEYEDPGTQGGNDGQGAKDGAAKGFKWPQAGGGSMLTVSTPSSPLQPSEEEYLELWKLWGARSLVRTPAISSSTGGVTLRS